MSLSAKIFFLPVFILSASILSAQLPGSEYDDDTRVEINIKYGYSGNYNYEWPEVRNLKLITIDAAYFKSNFSQWGYHSSNRWPALGDYALPFLINVAFNPEVGYQKVSTSLTGLFLGWHTHGISIISTKHFSLAPGIHWGDYSYSFRKYNAAADGLKEIEEPSGYYFALGPALITDISFFGMRLHYEGAWTKAWRMRELPNQDRIEGYPSPNFWNHLIIFQPFPSWHTGVEYAHVVNNGHTDNSGFRLAFYAGYSI